MGQETALSAGTLEEGLVLNRLWVAVVIRARHSRLLAPRLLRHAMRAWTVVFLDPSASERFKRKPGDFVEVRCTRRLLAVMNSRKRRSSSPSRPSTPELRL